MTADDFDNMEFTSSDEVDITMNDGSLRREYLHQGHANRVDFGPDEILIIGGDVGFDVTGIDLANVRNVVLVTRVA